MPMSTYMRRLRECWGESRLLVPSIAGVVRDGRNRVLLVQQRETGEWSTPGGAIELEDTPADAVVREVWEETGLLVRPTRLVAVYGGPNFIVRYRMATRRSTSAPCSSATSHASPDAE